jgi:hypothetical protein
MVLVKYRNILQDKEREVKPKGKKSSPEKNTIAQKTSKTGN